MAVKQRQSVIVKTVYGNQLQTARQLGMQHQMPENSTINQALREQNIIDKLPTPVTAGMEITDDYDPETDTPLLNTRYLVLGNKGHKSIQNVNDAIPYTVPVPHMATDVNVFSMLPLVARPIDDDLSVDERKQYGLRRTILIGKDLYAFYFALRLTFDRTTVDTGITQVVDGTSVTTDFVPTLDNLAPTPQADNTDYSNNYATVSAFVKVAFDQLAIEDILEATRLLFGNEQMAIVSEIALCHGIPKAVTGRYPNSGAQTKIAVPSTLYTEIVGMQSSVLATTYIPLPYINQKYEIMLNLGATEPLIGTTAK